MRPLADPLRWLLRVAAALGVAMLAVTFTPIVYWWATALAGAWDDPTGDVLIVLTGSSLDESTIGMNSYWRAVYATRVFKTERFAEMIVTGGPPREPAAVTMKTFIVAQGVPEEAVRVETASSTTRESAVNLAALLARETGRYGNRRLVLLTSDYHMWRAFRSFRHAGVTTLPRPIPDARKRYGQLMERWGICVELAQESGKIAYYWTRGWLSQPIQ